MLLGSVWYTSQEGGQWTLAKPMVMGITFGGDRTGDHRGPRPDHGAGVVLVCGKPFREAEV